MNTVLLKSVQDNAKMREITKFTGDDIQPLDELYAVDYLKTYTGSFPFLLDLAEKVEYNKTLSPAQIAGVLNCILREAKQLSKETTEEVTETTEITNTSIPVVHKVIDTKTGKAYSFEIKKPAFTDLDSIEDKMKAIEVQLAEVEKNGIVNQLTKFIDETDAEEKALFEEVQKKIELMRAEKLAKREELKAIQKNVESLKIELSKLATEKEKNDDLIKAQLRLDEITEQLDKLRAKAPWAEQILKFQWEDVCYIVAAFLDGKNGILNANDMGLGKTAESVFVLYLLRELFPAKFGYTPKVLWLTKKSLIQSSIREFRKWDPDTTPIPVSGKPNQREFIVNLALANNHPVVVNYDALNTTELLRTTQWDIIVMDEVHRLKGGANYNPTKVWENTADVCSRAKFIMPLSGSPIQNHPKEMWAYLYMLDPVRFPNVNQFVNQYCYGYDDGMTVNWDYLIKVLSNRVIRKSKAEVLKDLPDKTREFRYVEMPSAQRNIYDSLKENFFIWLDEQEENALTTTSILAQLTRLRQVALMPGSISIKDKNGIERSIDCTESAKLDEAMDIVEQLVANNEQVVIFSSQFNAPLFELSNRIKTELKVTVETMTGENSNQMSNIEQRFETGETRVLCINSKTGGEGLNLQTASHAIFLDLWWNPKFNEQCEDRLHRNGQKNAVTIHILQAEDSVDQFIAAILDKKEEMITGIMEDSSFRKDKGWKDTLMELI